VARLPKSTIVLAVATCIPFGLAIRDTAAGKYKLELSEREAEALERYGRDHDDDDEEDYRDVAARRELEEIENRKAIAEYEARQELERQERSERIKTLYSAEVAMMGTAFADIHLGDPAGKVTVESTPDAYLSLYDDGVTTLVSAPAPGSIHSGSSAFFAWASPDASRIIFDYTGLLTGDDTDSGIDTYERADGTTTLLSSGTIGPEVDFDLAATLRLARGKRVARTDREKRARFADLAVGRWIVDASAPPDGPPRGAAEGVLAAGAHVTIELPLFASIATPRAVSISSEAPGAMRPVSGQTSAGKPRLMALR
jgi:hypothetical protein